MQLLVRFGLALSLALTTLALAVAQDAKTGSPSGTPAQNRVAPGAIKNDVVLATVNGIEIKKSEILKTMSQINLGPQATIEDQYAMAANMVVNTILLVDHLNKNKYTVSKKEVDDEKAKYEEELKKQSKSLKQALEESNTPEDEFNTQITRAKMWEKYCAKNIDDAKLKRFADENKDYFQGAKVRARHILIKVAPDAAVDVQKKALDRIIEIRKEINSGKIEFADAANKYSEDDGNIQVKQGGDLGTFRRRGDILEEFAKAAFSLKPGVISDPLRTMFGYHIILVSERDDGQPLDFEKNKNIIYQQYEFYERERIITQIRETAKIDIKPMPADLKPPAPPAPPPTAPAATKGAGATSKQ